MSRTAAQTVAVVVMALILGACSKKTDRTGSTGGSSTESAAPDGSGGGGDAGGGGSLPQPDAPAHSATLNWVASTSMVDGYHVYRGTRDGGPYAVIGDVDSSTLTYTDKDVAAGSTYYYVVTAFIASPSAESVYSNQAAATIPTP